MNQMYSLRKSFMIAAVLAMLVYAIAGTHGVVHAGWEPPQRIPGFIDTGQNPYFVNDPTGKIHAFNTQTLDNQIVILYSNWTVDVGWTPPIDIIVSDAGQARIMGAFLDNDGMMSVILWGGNDLQAGIYITRASLEDVMRSTAWSAQLLIGRNAISPATAAVVSNHEGNIVVVYSGNEEGNGLYSISSNDYGVTWASPVPLYFTTNDRLWPSELQMYLSADDACHAVWALGDETGNSRRIYYSQLAAGAGDWRSPMVLAEAINYEADTPSIIEYEGRLMVIYHNDFPTTRFMIYSTDHGQSWSSPTRLFDLVGSNGAASLVIDGSDTLHMFFGNRDSSSLIHGVWHSTWLGESWSIPVAVISGPQILMGENDEEGFDPSQIQAVICQGNLVFISWRHDPVAGPTHIWFTYQFLDATHLPYLVTASPTVESTITPTALPSVNAVNDEDFGANRGELSVNSTSQLLLFSILPASILVTIVLLWRRRRH